MRSKPRSQRPVIEKTIFQSGAFICCQAFLKFCMYVCHDTLENYKIWVIWRQKLGHVVFISCLTRVSNIGRSCSSRWGLVPKPCVILEHQKPWIRLIHVILPYFDLYTARRVKPSFKYWKGWWSVLHNTWGNFYIHVFIFIYQEVLICLIFNTQLLLFNYLAASLILCINVLLVSYM